MRQPSTILARRADASLSVRDAHPPFLLPFLLPRACAEPGRARAAAELCADQPSPPRPDSSRQSLPHLTLHLCSTSPTSFGPSPGRNGAADRRRHCCPSLEHRPLRRAPSPGPPPRKSSHGELGRALLTLPDPLPTRIRCHRRRFAAAPPRTRYAPPAHAAGPPCAPPLAVDDNAPARHPSSNSSIGKHPKSPPSLFH